MATVDVWWARPGDERPGHGSLLDPVEQQRRAGLRRAEDRARFTVATAVVKLVAGPLLGLAPSKVHLDRTCDRCGRPHGRPTLPGGLSVSISHSGDRVLIAFTGPAVDTAGTTLDTAGPPVGVDVEQITDVDFTGMAGLVLAPGETATTLPDFFRYWTRKEAVVKATGEGLAMPLAQVAVTPPGQPPALLRYGDRTDLTACLADLPADGYAAAVAVLAPGPLQVRHHDAATLW